GADHGAEPALAEEEGEAIATGTAPAVHENGLRSTMSELRTLPVFAIADCVVVQDFATEQLDETVRDLAAGIPTLIDDQRRLGVLRAELPVELVLPLL